ncbi:MAG: lipoyl synthase [Sedimentisphaerales bacterium]|nr:lipoyl synthase [Sedimentisphaerales bacterium]
MEQSIEQNKINVLQIIDCGLADYREVLQLQHELRDKRRECKIPNTVLIVEHPSVITLGARQSANKLLADKEGLAKRHIDVVETRRGGGATAHNPGQLVFYPILHLQQLGLGITEYIRKLEAIGIELLAQLGIHSQRRKGFPGLWVGDKKIASIGVRVSRGVTYHGMAINIQNDLSIFDLLIPCGLDGVEMTSMLKETGKHHSMKELKKKLSRLLIKYFSPQNEPQAHSDDGRWTMDVGRETTYDIRHTIYDIQASHERQKLPNWLRRPLPAGETYKKVENVLSSLNLQTICNNANCPNRGQCWERGTATVLILGKTCTRNCKFCSVTTGKPDPPDTSEPSRLAEMARQLQLKYLVITSVDRDDLPDGGASHFRDCLNRVRQKCPGIKLEILTPDFRNCQIEAIKILRDALPFVFAHNVETVASLYPAARAGGNYHRSLNLLKLAKQKLDGIPTKSSIMLGLGETDTEVEKVLNDLRDVGCDRITIGQYLKPSKDSLEVVEYVNPAKFDFWKQKAIDLGFTWVISSPFARSSYFAEQDRTF